MAGWIGVPLAAFALYGGLALLLEDSASETVLPLGRRGRARTSLEGAPSNKSSAQRGRRESAASSDARQTDSKDGYVLAVWLC